MSPRRPQLPKPPWPPRLPEEPPPGPTRPEFWRSPLRGPWLTSLLGTALLPLVIVCAVTGFLSQAAYDPDLGRNSLLPSGGIGADVFFFDWPTSPAWIYAVNQGLHVTSGLLAIPILLAKLWSVMPKLFEWPPIRSLAHLLERASLALLVGGSIFVFFTGLINVQVYYPWPFRFVPAHYYGALIFLAAFALHVGLKLPFAWRKLRERGVAAPLRADLAHTEPEPYEPEHTAPLAPAAPTITRRAMLGTVAAASLGAGWVAATQAIGGPLRELGLLGPHSTKLGDGPNRVPDQQDRGQGGSRQGGDRPELAAGAERRPRARALARAAAGAAPVLLRPADRLRRRLVDDPALDRRAAARPRRPGGHR